MKFFEIEDGNMPKQKEGEMPELNKAHELVVPSGEDLMNGNLPNNFFDGGVAAIETQWDDLQYMEEMRESPSCVGEIYMTPKSYIEVQREKLSRGSLGGCKRKAVIQEVEQVDTDESNDINVLMVCGKCEFKKVEDNYSQKYFLRLYGNLKCCDEDCKEKNKTMRELITKGNGHCMWVCQNCEIEDERHNCQQMYCNVCYFKKLAKESGGSNSRVRRSARV